MNYYEHHIGDWDQATAHLTAVEDGIYSRMVRWYMASESPLPLDVAAIQRRVRARARDEKAAVQALLDEFFERREDGYHQHRCDEEIARFQDKQRKAKASADARWSKDKANSERNANGSQTDDANGMRTHSEGNALHTPDTNHQEKKPSASSPAKLPTCPTQDLIDLYHELLPDLPRVRLLTKDRTRALQKTWAWCLTSKRSDGSPRAEHAEQALHWFREYFARAGQNDFLMGRTPRSGEHANWRCDLDFLLTERGMKHVIEKTLEPA